MQYGDVITILEKRASEGKVVKALQERPVLSVEQELIWQGFGELSLSRGRGWGTAPICYADLYAWTQLNELYGEKASYVTSMIVALDREAMQLLGARETDNTKSKGN